MALVSGGRSSTLNPNAPIFVPAALRQVEDFSPEWWNLVTTSTWFHDYWVSQQEGDNFYAADVEEDDIAHLLPETFDLGADDDFFTMEAQLEEFLQLSESEGNKFSQPASRAVPKSGLETYPEPVIKSLSLTKIVKDLTPKHSFEQAQYQEKPAKRVGPKLSPRCIQQPR